MYSILLPNSIRPRHAQDQYNLVPISTQTCTYIYKYIFIYAYSHADLAISQSHNNLFNCLFIYCLSTRNYLLVYPYIKLQTVFAFLFIASFFLCFFFNIYLYTHTKICIHKVFLIAFFIEIMIVSGNERLKRFTPIATSNEQLGTNNSLETYSAFNC